MSENTLKKTIEESSLIAANFAFHLIQVEFFSESMMRLTSAKIKELEQDKIRNRFALQHYIVKKKNLKAVQDSIKPLVSTFETKMAENDNQGFYYDRGDAIHDLFKLEPMQYSILLECVKILFADGVELAEQRLGLFEMVSKLDLEKMCLVSAVINGDCIIENTDDVEPKKKGRPKKTLQV